LLYIVALLVFVATIGPVLVAAIRSTVFVKSVVYIFIHLILFDSINIRRFLFDLFLFYFSLVSMTGIFSYYWVDKWIVFVVVVVFIHGVIVSVDDVCYFNFRFEVELLVVLDCRFYFMPFDGSVSIVCVFSLFVSTVLIGDDLRIATLFRPFGGVRVSALINVEVAVVDVDLRV